MAIDLVIGRSGDSLAGRVLNLSFRIKTAFGTLEVPARQIRRIYLFAPRTRRPDEVYLKNSDKLVGIIQGDSVALRLSAGTELSIPFKAVLAILIEWISEPDYATLVASAKPLARRRKARRR